MLKIHASEDWLRVSAEDGAKLPRQIVDTLAGRKFSDLYHLCAAFWEAAVDDPAIAKRLNLMNIERIASGRPFRDFQILGFG